MAPPQSVAVAAPIPTHYFSQATGPLLAYPSAFQQTGHVQPSATTIPVFRNPIQPNPGQIVPVALPPSLGQVKLPGNWRSILPAKVPGPVMRIGTAIQNWQFTNPVSYWQRQIESRRFGRIGIGGF